MLDALVSEARDRWGLDVSAGIQIVPAERLTGTPIEASRPLLVVPLALLGVEGESVTSDALPGRHGPAGRDPLAVLRRLYPADGVVARLGVGAATGAPACLSSGARHHDFSFELLPHPG